MDWFNRLEQRRASIIFAVVLIAAATLIVSALRIFKGFDPYWHLQMGKDWIENGLSPWIDHYSFTFPGQEIIGPPVIFQVTLYWLVQTFGEFGGFFAVRLAGFLVALTMMLLWLRQIRAPVLAYCIVIPILAFLLQMRGIARPELLSYSLSILALMLYQRSRLQLSFKSMWPIAALFLFWTNYHSSILAYVIFFGLFVDIALRLIGERAPLKQWSFWAAWGLVVVGIGFLNPNFNHVLLQFLTFSSEWKAMIQEYGSPEYLLRTPSGLVIIPPAVLTVLMLARQGKFGFLTVSLVFLYAGITMSRMVTPGGIVVLCFFAHALSTPNVEIWLKNAPSAATRSIAVLSLIGFLVPMLLGVQNARGFLVENRQPFNQSPLDLTQHMITNGMSGRIFNDYGVGGFLIYSLPRENPVYIDGRTGILYPVEHFQKQLEAKANPDVFLAEVEKYEIDFAILEASDNTARLMADAEFQLEFVDYQYALYARESGRLVNSGKLWADPACWSPEIAASLEGEWVQALFALPQNARIMPLLSAASDYTTSTNLSEFFENAAMAEWLTDATRRFLGYRALETGDHEYALEQFSSVDRWEPEDYLAVALAYLRLGNPGDAEQILDRATRNKWSRLDFGSLLILHALLHEISQEKQLELFDAAYVKDLEASLGSHSLPARGEDITVGTFCAWEIPSTETR